MHACMHVYIYTSIYINKRARFTAKYTSPGLHFTRYGHKFLKALGAGFVAAERLTGQRHNHDMATTPVFGDVRKYLIYTHTYIIWNIMIYYGI